jgi:hypothetical protein
MGACRIHGTEKRWHVITLPMMFVVPTHRYQTPSTSQPRYHSRSSSIISSSQSTPPANARVNPHLRSSSLSRTRGPLHGPFPLQAFLVCNSSPELSSWYTLTAFRDLLKCLQVSRGTPYFRRNTVSSPPPYVLLEHHNASRGASYSRRNTVFPPFTITDSPSFSGSAKILYGMSRGRKTKPGSGENMSTPLQVSLGQIHIYRKTLACEHSSEISHGCRSQVNAF